MNNRFFLLISWIIFLNPPIIEGAVIEFNVDESRFDSLEIRNPFLSQLPKKEEPKPAVPAVADHPPEPADFVPVVMAPVQSVILPPKGERQMVTSPPPEVSLPELAIAGLVWDTDRPQAIVNNEIVNVGDTVSGVRIIAIKKTGLDVFFNGKDFSVGP